MDPVQRVSALVLVVGLILLLTVWSHQAGAADASDQITGAGTTESTVTTSWSDGLLGTNNATVVTPRSQGSLNAAFYAGEFNDFKNIKVTVSQTQDLVHQAVQVTWTGASPTATNIGSDYFQLMECYGDAATGPDPEDCEYGADGLTAAGGAAYVNTRSGNECPVGNVVSGCDPLETDSSHASPSQTGLYQIPFVPVGTTNNVDDTPATGLLSQYYDKYTSDEVEQAVTTPAGTGSQYFQVLTGAEAPGLGCGEPDSATGAGADGERDCWLVIVPRGEYKPNGFQINPNANGPASQITGSPLQASDWAMRMQIHLGFVPIPAPCPIGSAAEREMVGTQLAADAVFSWQVALNAQAKCSRLYGYTETPEATATTQLAAGTAGGAAGMAFTTIPIGSEAGRESNTQTPSPVPVTYAPVAISGLTLSFQVNLSTGYRTQPIKLTPRLVAKALTQSYTYDLPEYTPGAPQGPLPVWAKSNPATIVFDPEFQALNPGVPSTIGGIHPTAPLMGEDHSSVNEQLWQWVLSDPTAVAWLNGTPDQWGMVVNPSYGSLKLGASPADSFPRADPNCLDTGQGTVGHPSTRCGLDMVPYVDDFATAAVDIRSGLNPEGAIWDPTKTAPDGSSGWWSDGSIENPGSTFLWGFTDTANAAGYGLVAAALCNADGTSCATLSESSVNAALGVASADSAGLLHVDPAKAPAGAYPLVDVIYAAARTNDSPAAVADYADFIAYAAGPGQTVGEAPGDLPRGYLPLTDSLEETAQAAVTALRSAASGSASATASTQTATQGTTANGLGSTSVGGGSGGDGSVGDGAAAQPSSGGADAASANQSVATSSAGPAAVIKPTSTPIAYATPAQPAPTARFATIGIILGGVVGLVGGPLTRIVGRRRARP